MISYNMGHITTDYMYSINECVYVPNLLYIYSTLFKYFLSIKMYKIYIFMIRFIHIASGIDGVVC